MNNSKRIYQIEEAQFTDLGSKPLGEVPSQSRAIYDAIVAIGNTVFPNSPGQTFTAGLTAGGLAPVTLNGYYWNNKKVIDGYFQKIDMEKLGDAIGPGVHQSVEDSFTGGGLLVGLVAGFIIAKVLTR